MEKGWAGLPYYPISQFYASRFGGKVYKIPVSVVETCPNREGLKGMETCVFCDVWGSAAKSESLEMPLQDQIEKYQASISKKFNVSNFLVYFQAYTNTFTKVSKLKENFDLALSYPFVKGFVIGTRPDCISPMVLNLWKSYSEKSFVSVELGVQSFFDHHLKFMRRGHDRAQSIEAIHKIAELGTVDLGVHLIFGNPNETDEEIVETAELLNHLPIKNVKLHNLHVLEHTPLADIYREGKFSPIEREAYAKRVELFLQHLSPEIAIHRLAALSSRWDELISPQWTRDKMGTHQYIVDFLRHNHSYQSQYFHPHSPEQILLKNNLRNCSIRLEERSISSRHHI